MEKQQRKRGMKVAPLSTARIRHTAGVIRGLLCPDSVGPVDMGRIVEQALPSLMEGGFWFEVLPVEEMGQDEARTYPDEGIMQIREDVYEQLIDGGARARFTVAHELGHMVLHINATRSPYFARNSTDHKVYEDSEWQADTFAAEFLMPYDEAKKCRSPEAIAARFGVSIAAARIRFKKING